MTWDVRELAVPQPLEAISVGTLPVSIVSTLVFPNWLGSSPFDLRWAALHVVLGTGFWYAVGRLGEPARAWRNGLVAHLIARAVTIPASMTFFRNGWSEIRDLVLITAWCVAPLWLLWMAGAVIVRRTLAARQKAK